MYACFVDFRKAYDSDWREGLFYKLLKNGISSKFVELIQDMYARLQICIKLKSGISFPFTSQIGLKQGCNLSPLLFNLFINDLPKLINETPGGDPPFLSGVKVSSLLYADDLVLLSHSKDGLQKLINTLKKYTDDWFLDINMSKTKYMIFSKGGKYVTQELLFMGSEQLMQCDSYCYSGVIFCRSGSFKDASLALNNKAKGAMYSLLNNIYKHQTVKVDIMLELFDRMIMPILLYNSEVWGTHFLPQNPNNNNLLNKGTLTKNISEITQTKFLKSVLKIPSRTSNWAVNAETGRYPVATKVFKLMIKYLFHLNKNQSHIIRAALQTSILLDSQGKKSWFSFVKRVIKFLSFDHLLYTSDLREVYLHLAKLGSSINKAYSIVWNKERGDLSKGKLDILKSIKTDFGKESYLDYINVPDYRSDLTKMRVSAHKFPIETDRYLNIPREKRCCPLGCQKVGDELHYALHCDHPSIKKLRFYILNYFVNLNPTFKNIKDREQLKIILNPPNPEAAHLVGKFCYKVQRLFNKITY